MQIAFLICFVLLTTCIEGNEDSTQRESCSEATCIHGRCIQLNGRDSTCECGRGFIGRSCEARDPCYSPRRSAQGDWHLELRCLHGGNCSVTPRENEYEYECACPTGFVGRHCETIDVRHECGPLDKHECVNGGVCLLQNNRTKCHCTPPFTGPKCESLSSSTSDGNENSRIDRPPQPVALTRTARNDYRNWPNYPHAYASPSQFRFDCRKTPCKNNGTCLYNQQANAYKCKCDAKKWKGEQCEALVTCSDNPCWNGATCSNTTLGYTCICAIGYGGRDCSVSLNPCDTCPDTCIRSGNTSMCPCPFGMFGVFCNYTDYCATGQPCQNNGACYRFIDGASSNYTCSCPAQFTGRNCELDVNECALALDRSVCENGGTCVNTHGSYSCHCPRGYGGSRCDAVINGCELEPCANGGTCYDPLGNGDVTCDCPPQYTGQFCTVLVTSTPIKTSTKLPTTITTSAPSSTTWDYNNAMLACSAANCASEPNGVCDEQCNNPACDYDHGDCAFGQTPFVQCLALKLHNVQCDQLFGNGVCDPQCNNARCLFDGHDCMFWSPNSTTRSSVSITSPTQCPASCVALYANGVCNSECNQPACAYDGLDCDSRKPLSENLVLVLDVSYLKFSSNITLQNAYLLKISWQLQLVVRQVSINRVGSTSASDLSRKKRQTDDQTQLTASLDASKCSSSDCITSASVAAHYVAAVNLGTSSASNNIWPQLQVISVSTVANTDSQQQTQDSFFANPLAKAFTIVASMLVVAVIIASVVVAARKAADARQAEQNGQSSNSDQHSQDDESPSRGSSTPTKVQANLWIPPFEGGRTLSKPVIAPLSFSRTKTASWQSQNSSATMLSSTNGDVAECTVLPKRPRFTAARETAYEMQDGSFHDSEQERPDDDDGTTRSKEACYYRGHRHKSRSRANGTLFVMSKPNEVMKAATFGSGLEPELEHDPESTMAPEVSIGKFLRTDCLADIKSANQLSEAIREMARKGVSVNARCEPHGETALHIACRFGRPSIVKQLLDCGADINATDFAGRTPLHAAIAADSHTCFSLLFGCSQTNLNAVTRNEGLTPLMVAVKLAIDIELVKELLQAKNVDINAVDSAGRSALHWAAVVNNVDAVRQLLLHGANYDAQDQCEQTALFLAAREGNFEAARLLLSERANPEIPDYEGRTPRQVAREKSRDQIVQLIDHYFSINASFLRQPFVMQDTMRASMPFSNSNPNTVSVMVTNAASASMVTPYNATSHRVDRFVPNGGTNASATANSSSVRNQKNTLKATKSKERLTKPSSSNSAQLVASPPTDLGNSPSSVFTTNNTPPSLNAFASAPNSSNTSPSHRTSSVPIAVAATGVAQNAGYHALSDQLQQPSSTGSADSGYGHGSNSISPPQAGAANSNPSSLFVGNSAMARTHTASDMLNTACYAVQSNVSGEKFSVNSFPRPPPSVDRATNSMICSFETSGYSHYGRISQYPVSCQQNQADFQFGYNNPMYDATMNRQISGVNSQIDQLYTMPESSTRSKTFGSPALAHTDQQLIEIQQHSTVPQSVQYDFYSQNQGLANSRIRYDADLQNEALYCNPDQPKVFSDFDWSKSYSALK